MTQKESILIIGAGLSGLSLAYFLQQKNIKAIILEASSRLGGRIQTLNGNLGTPLELGATWFGDQHQHLLTLLKELGLSPFPQYSKGITLFQTKSFEPPQQFFIPESEAPSYRIAGGTQRLIEILAAKLSSPEIHLNTKVTAVRTTEDGVEVNTADGEVFQGAKVVICIPPQLAAAQIIFSPELPAELQAILPGVQTWMANAVKFALEYSEPFWRKKGFSGMLFSHADIVVEMYDHTNVEENRYGFTGFLNGGTANFSTAVRKENVLRQLSGLLGPEAQEATAYFDKVWNDPLVIEGSPRIERPHQYHGHPLLQAEYLDGRLQFGGTETASENPGYMDGAIAAAIRVAARIG